MKLTVTIGILLFLLCGWDFGSIRAGVAQERDAAIGKILNPLPDFDPFEKPAAPSQFFPDEVDKRTREALIDALTGRAETLEDHVRFLREKDASLRKERGTVTGLTGPMQDLRAASIKEREHYLAAQKKALDDASSPQREQLLESLLKQDDLNRADRLMSQSSTNRWAGFFNRFLGSVDLVSIAAGSYIGAAVDTTMSQLFAISADEMSVEERRALVHYLDHLKRYPYEARNPEIWKQVDALDQKKKDILVRKQFDKAAEASDEGDLEKALFHHRLAAMLDPHSRVAEKALAQAEKRYQEFEDERHNGLAAAAQPDPPEKQEQDAGRLMRALSLRDRERIQTEAARIERQYQDQPFADSARDASAVALEIDGRHEEAKKIVERIARSSDHDHQQKRAAHLLESPEYNLLASFHEARGERRLQTFKYVLLGEDLLKKNLLYGAAPLAVAGPAGAVMLGAANAIMLGTNVYQVVTANPVSAQPVIDKGVAYIRSHPESADATAVYKVLAEAYEERGAFDKAITYYQLAEDTPKETIDELKEKAAKALLQSAAKSPARGAQEFYLKAILDDFPDSAAAAEATQKLATMVKDENQGLRMSKKFLQDNPELYGPQGLGLKGSLFDGHPKNMELADRGVTLLGEGEILLHYQTPWGVHSHSYPLSPQTSERFFMALRQKNHEVAMADVNRRAKGSIGGIANVPLEVLKAEVAATERPEEGRDTTLSLVREAAGPAPVFPKVLDHQLLSENEIDPAGKYKLPPIQGSISASQFGLSGGLPAGLWGNRLAVGNNQGSPFAGIELPIPLLQGFIPVDFLLQGRPGGLSVFPKIHTTDDKSEDQDLYR